ncbi:MAG: ATP-binding protein [Firmicutes bacterium]|nr:ATP-binding protein [[Eubacterium] siraeum]MCM1487814.1 ATP-binding protein [Bacillota bacterium]
MSYLQKYYTMAEDSLRDRKNRNREIQERHIAEAEAKIPQIKELRKRLYSGGAKLATILISSKNPQKDVAKISEENIAINRQIKGLLKLNGFKENYLEPVYSCNKCNDTGIYEGKRCSCFMDDVTKFQCEELNRSSAMNLCSFDTFDLSLYSNEKRGSEISPQQKMDEVFRYCLDFAQNFHLPQNGILMIGGTGLGKTHLSLSIGSEVIKKGGYSVIYGSAPDLFRKIEKEHFGNAPDLSSAQLLQDCDLLILDDLGAEFDSKFNLSTLYNIINSRMNSGKPTVISTNFTLQELQERYGGRIMSRLLTLYDLTFCGNDIRLLNKFKSAK